MIVCEWLEAHGALFGPLLDVIGGGWSIGDADLAVILYLHAGALAGGDGDPLQSGTAWEGVVRERGVHLPARLTILERDGAGLRGRLELQDPAALGLGPGAETRAPMARGIIGGIVLSTLVTLLLVPVFYVLIERLRGTSTKLVVAPPEEGLAKMPIVVAMKSAPPTATGAPTESLAAGRVEILDPPGRQ